MITFGSHLKSESDINQFKSQPSGSALTKDGVPLLGSSRLNLCFTCSAIEFSLQPKELIITRYMGDELAH